MNKAILMGRLTREPELSHTASNVSICKFTLAIDRRFAKNGETDFINITTWDKTADFCSKYFVKGQKVSVVGRIQVDSWDGEDGKKRYATGVVAEEAYFAESKRDSQANGANTDGVKANADDGFYPVDDGKDDLPF